MNRDLTHASMKSRTPLMGKFGDFISQSEEVSETSVCQDCGAVYMDGSWRWTARPPQEASKTTCIACRRMNDKQPAGVVTIQGKFLREHGDELLTLMRNIELEKKAANPLQRIMSIDKRSEKLSIATTDVQLARSMGRALREQHKGSLDFSYHKGDSVLRVLWQR